MNLSSNDSQSDEKERQEILDETAERFAHIVLMQIQEKQQAKKDSEDTSEELNP